MYERASGVEEDGLEHGLEVNVERGAVKGERILARSSHELTRIFKKVGKRLIIVILSKAPAAP